MIWLKLLSVSIFSLAFAQPHGTLPMLAPIPNVLPPGVPNPDGSCRAFAMEQSYVSGFPNLPTGFQFSEKLWDSWLKAADHAGTPPNSTLADGQPSVADIYPCGPPPANAPPNCYQRNLAPVSPALRLPITKLQRQQMIQFYALRFGLLTSANKDEIRNIFNVLGGGPAAVAAAHLPAPPPNMINAFAARARYRLLQNIGAWKCINAKFASSANPVDHATMLSNSSMIANLQRQVNLLDYFFPDAAIWQMVIEICVSHGQCIGKLYPP